MLPAMAGRPTDEEVYTPIALSNLRVDTLVGFDLYLVTRKGENPILYRHRDLTFSEEIRSRLLENHIDRLYVSFDQTGAYHAYMEANIRRALSDPGLNVADKTQILYSTSAEMIRQFLEDPSKPDLVPRTQAMVGAAVDQLLSEKNSFATFLKTSPLDYRTYTHSVDVAMYTLNLAQRVGIKDQKLLHEIGVGTYLHDLGKSRIPDRILNKPRALNNAEWHTMRKHPEWGREILIGHGVSSDVVLSITRDHHEKIDGSGYPRGVPANELPDYVRMTTICDVFDALTTQRAYKERLDSFPALGIMRSEMSKQLDPELFEAFIQMLHS